MDKHAKVKDSTKPSRLSYRQIVMLMIVITIGSKVFGFIREVLMTKYFGSSGATDAFYFATSMTSFFVVYLVASIQTTFIPVLADADKEENTDMRRVAANLFNIVTLFSVILMILGVIFIRPLTHILAGGIAAQSPENFELTVTLSRIAMLNILFPGIIGVLTGYLRYNGSHLSPAMIGFPLNAVFFIYLIAYSQKLGVVGLTWVSVLASATQILILIPSLKRRKFLLAPVLDFKDVHARKMARYSIPVLFSTTISEARSVIDKALASWLPTGSITYLQYGSMVRDLVTTVFISTIATVDYPNMSRAYAANEPERVHKMIIRTFRIIVILIVPVAVFLLSFSQPVLRILFQRGKFTPEHTMMTASVLSTYAIGLPASSFRSIIYNAFHANKNTKTPALFSFLSLIVYLAFAFVTYKTLGAPGIALARSISAYFTTISLAFIIQRREGFKILRKGEYLLLVKVGILIGASFAFLKYGLVVTEGFLQGAHAGSIQFILLSLATVMLFIILGYLLNIEEIRALLHLSWKKLKGTKRLNN